MLIPSAKYAALTVASGTAAAPTANAVVADTGALTAGEWELDFHVFVSDTSSPGRCMVIEHRNAANDATLATLGGCAPNAGTEFGLDRYTLAANERVRVIAGPQAAAANALYVAAIYHRRV